MGNIFGFNVPIDMPSLGFGSTIIWFMMFMFLIFVVGGVAFFVLHRFKIYNKTIIIYENISGQGYRKTGVDRARLIKVGDGGEEILWLLKKKVFRSAYGRKMGLNEYWFAIGQDGYWYNVVLGDVDAKMGMLDIEPIDRDMRYMHVAIRRNIIDRYKKTNFMDKYATYIFNGVIMVVLIIGGWFLLDKIGEIAGQTASNLEIVGKVADKMGEVASSLDNICSGGSGLRPVN